MLETEVSGGTSAALLQPPRPTHNCVAGCPAADSARRRHCGRGGTAAAHALPSRLLGRSARARASRPPPRAHDWARVPRRPACARRAARACSSSWSSRRGSSISGSAGCSHSGSLGTQGRRRWHWGRHRRTGCNVDANDRLLAVGGTTEVGKLPVGIQLSNPRCAT